MLRGDSVQLIQVLLLGFTLLRQGPLRLRGGFIITGGILCFLGVFGIQSLFLGIPPITHGLGHTALLPQQMLLLGQRQ